MMIPIEGHWNKRWGGPLDPRWPPSIPASRWAPVGIDPAESLSAIEKPPKVVSPSAIYLHIITYLHIYTYLYIWLWMVGISWHKLECQHRCRPRKCFRMTSAVLSLEHHPLEKSLMGTHQWWHASFLHAKSLRVFMSTQIISPDGMCVHRLRIK